MHEVSTLVLSLLAGMALGTIFFGGLWLTVQKSVSSTRPAFWFLLSLLARMGIVLTGFILVSGGHWQRMLGCLLGFVIARLMVTRYTHATKAAPYRAREA